MVLVFWTKYVMLRALTSNFALLYDNMVFIDLPYMPKVDER